MRKNNEAVNKKMKRKREIEAEEKNKKQIKMTYVCEEIIFLILDFVDDYEKFKIKDINVNIRNGIVSGLKKSMTIDMDEFFSYKIIEFIQPKKLCIFNFEQNSDIHKMMQHYKDIRSIFMAIDRDNNNIKKVFNIDSPLFNGFFDIRKHFIQLLDFYSLRTEFYAKLKHVKIEEIELVHGEPKYKEISDFIFVTINDLIVKNILDETGVFENDLMLSDKLNKYEGKYDKLYTKEEIRHFLCLNVALNGIIKNECQFHYNTYSEYKKAMYQNDVHVLNDSIILHPNSILKKIKTNGYFLTYNLDYYSHLQNLQYNYSVACEVPVVIFNYTNNLTLLEVFNVKNTNGCSSFQFDFMHNAYERSKMGLVEELRFNSCCDHDFQCIEDICSVNMKNINGRLKNLKLFKIENKSFIATYNYDNGEFKKIKKVL